MSKKFKPIPGIPAVVAKAFRELNMEQGDVPEKHAVRQFFDVYSIMLIEIDEELKEGAYALKFELPSNHGQEVLYVFEHEGTHATAVVNYTDFTGDGLAGTCDQILFHTDSVVGYLDQKVLMAKLDLARMEERLNDGLAAAKIRFKQPAAA